MYILCSITRNVCHWKDGSTFLLGPECPARPHAGVADSGRVPSGRKGLSPSLSKPWSCIEAQIRSQYVGTASPSRMSSVLLSAPRSLCLQRAPSARPPHRAGDTSLLDLLSVEHHTPHRVVSVSISITEERCFLHIAKRSISLFFFF